MLLISMCSFWLCGSRVDTDDGELEDPENSERVGQELMSAIYYEDIVDWNQKNSQCICVQKMN